MLQENKAAVLRYVEAFNRGDLDALSDTFAADALIYGVLGWGEVEKVKPIWRDLIRCFQFNLQVESMVAEGDVVAVRYTERGKSVVSFRGGPVTGRSFEVTAMEWFEVRDGRIRRRWGARDSAAIFQQMGLPPA
ncbi:conserved hypothetical protein, steroid delta-isomerase-related [Rhizobiales bacterium GAS191]|jgi:steroid delta-isomerase-like uncharacterized protein|nr:conserved hypothetical protein, steroid delta-isomerase-related [Rhizobiales bacterium GAS113]SEC51579.1 conserved hypothetical protein, steroid delta-isomerase-related [Rhizobiales bacterium GAS191]SEC75199.1 conserved hypothetical protein, steroid delta-isomerase-related [Rhizobiales bacterium GAS188]